MNSPTVLKNFLQFSKGYKMATLLKLFPGLFFMLKFIFAKVTLTCP